MDTYEIAITVLAVLLFGATTALIGVVTRLDKKAKDDAERLYLALPPVWQDAIMKLIDAADAVVRVSKEITDGKENT